MSNLLMLLKKGHTCAGVYTEGGGPQDIPLTHSVEISSIV